MSRSYKYHPFGGDSKDKYFKRLANKRVRKSAETLQNNQYRRKLSSWEICDYFGYCSFQEYWEYELESWYQWAFKYYPFPDKEESYQKWCKWYLRK